jgi:RNA polymerase sigma-70 factor (ECF subfamily)
MARRDHARVHDPEPRTLARARRGDPAAFEDLVRSFQADVFGLALALTRDRAMAEDVTQETFLRAFRFLGGFRDGRRFAPWLLRICRNCAYDAIRRRPPVVALPDDGIDARTQRVTASAGGGLADAVARSELAAALRALTPDHRDAFLLIEVFGLTYGEAAEVLAIRVGTAKSRVFRARKALVAALDEAADEGETTDAVPADTGSAAPAPRHERTEVAP